MLIQSRLILLSDIKQIAQATAHAEPATFTIMSIVQ